MAQWFDSRHGVELDPETEIVATIGTKQGMCNLLLSLLSSGEAVILPTPSYPVHTSAAFISGASVLGVPLFPSFEHAEAEQYLLDEESSFFERLNAVCCGSWPRPRLMILSFPTIQPQR